VIAERLVWPISVELVPELPDVRWRDLSLFHAARLEGCAPLRCHERAQFL
jgi:hypothetical protein